MQEYQCPLGLGLHFYLGYRFEMNRVALSINALSGWGSISTPGWHVALLGEVLYQCPFGLVLHFYI